MRDWLNSETEFILQMNKPNRCHLFKSRLNPQDLEPALVEKIKGLRHSSKIVTGDIVKSLIWQLGPEFKKDEESALRQWIYNF